MLQHFVLNEGPCGASSLFIFFNRVETRFRLLLQWEVKVSFFGVFLNYWCFQACLTDNVKISSLLILRWTPQVNRITTAWLCSCEVKGYIATIIHQYNTIYICSHIGTSRLFTEESDLVMGWHVNVLTGGQELRLSSYTSYCGGHKRLVQDN